MRHAHLGEKACIFEAQCHPEGVYVDATGVWEESDRAIPGEICALVREDQHRREAM
jgi:hypothetical protein